MKTLSAISIMIVLMLSAFVGHVPMHLGALVDMQSIDSTIFYQLRLPRVILAFLAGGILALSGLLFQTLFRNPLTTPFTLGISGGATLGAALAIIFGFHTQFLGFSAVTFFAFLGALLTVGLIYIFSQKLSSTTDHRLILVGIALTFFFSSLLLILYYLSDFEESYLIMRFSMGSLNTVGFLDVIPLLFASILILWIAKRYQTPLRLLSISYDFAYLRGIAVNRIILTLFVVISLAVGALVSITGPIGFVGLIIPHMVKLVFKKSAQDLHAVTFLAGGMFLVLCDTLSRGLPTVSEIPVGIITSLIGGIIFISILLKKD